MVNQKVKYGLIMMLLLSVAFGAGRFSNPAKVVTKTEYKEIIKEVEVKKEQKNVVVYTKKTTKTDGTIVEETKSEDKTTTYQDKRSESSKELATSNITTRDIGLSVNVYAAQNLQHTDRGREYGIFVKKRIIGNINVGGMVSDQKTVGLSVGLDF